MRATFKLEGLGCANCAAKMESKIKKIDGVTSASVNFLAAKLFLETADDKFDGVIAEAEKIVKKIESHVKMVKI